MIQHNLHSKILIEPNFVPEKICDFLVQYTKSQDLIDLKVFDAEQTNKTKEVKWQIDTKIRDTQTVDITPVRPLLDNILRSAVIDIINPFFNIHIKSSECPQILRYGIGGHYDEHIDAEGKFNNNGTIEWRKTVDRDISILFYLNDDYKGGDLFFPNQHIYLRPQKGMLVAFPSYHQFSHGVLPVIDGERFSVVTWASLTI